MPKKSFDGEAFANDLLSDLAAKNVEIGAKIVADTFANPNECEFNLLPMGVKVAEDGTRVAAHRFRPYRKNERHTGLSDAILLVSLDDEIKLNDTGEPLYRITGEKTNRSRHGYKVIDVMFGEFDGGKFIPKS